MKVKINDEMLKAAPRALLSRGHAFCWYLIASWLEVASWLSAQCCKCSWEVLSTATASHQPQSAGFDQRLDALNMREKCDAACRRDLGNASGYTFIRFDSVMSMQRMKLVQTPFSQSLASRLGCCAPHQWDKVIRTRRAQHRLDC